jgi:hypothetical protein
MVKWLPEFDVATPTREPMTNAIAAVKMYTGLAAATKAA